MSFNFLLTRNKMSTGKRKRVSLGEKFKAITDIESGLKPSKVAEKYDVPRNTISTWIKKKKEIKSAFSSGEVSLKRILEKLWKSSLLTNSSL